MKIRKYWDIFLDPSRSYAENLLGKDNLEKLKETLIRKYGSEAVEEEWTKLTEQLGVLVNCTDNLNGKTILDLGCGCRSNSFYSDRVRGGRTFEPWLCRVLSELGIKNIGIDIGSLAGEPFEHYTEDLTKPDSLNFLPNSSVDIANSRLLFTSPELCERARFYSPAKAIEAMKQILFPQLERILKPDGTFVYSE